MEEPMVERKPTNKPGSHSECHTEEGGKARGPVKAFLWLDAESLNKPNHTQTLPPVKACFSPMFVP